MNRKRKLLRDLDQLLINLEVLPDHRLEPTLLWTARGWIAELVAYESLVERALAPYLPTEEGED